MKRIRQMVLIVSFLGVCWLGMQMVHEAGHVMGAWLTGGRVERVALVPWEFSRTDVDPNPQPLAVVWLGPVAGCYLPVPGYWLAKGLKWPGAPFYRFFAGFCLVANGLYIGLGEFDKIGDAGDMLRYGSPHWTLYLFGILTVPVGFYLWNGLGYHFGLGKAGGQVSQRAMAVSGILLLVLVAMEWGLSYIQNKWIQIGYHERHKCPI